MRIELVGTMDDHKALGLVERPTLSDPGGNPLVHVNINGMIMAAEVRAVYQDHGVHSHVRPFRAYLETVPAEEPANA